MVLVCVTAENTDVPTQRRMCYREEGERLYTEAAFAHLPVICSFWGNPK